MRVWTVRVGLGGEGWNAGGGGGGVRVPVRVGVTVGLRVEERVEAAAATFSSPLRSGW